MYFRRVDKLILTRGTLTFDESLKAKIYLIIFQDLYDLYESNNGIWHRTKTLQLLQQGLWLKLIIFFRFPDGLLHGVFKAAFNKPELN